MVEMEMGSCQGGKKLHYITAFGAALTGVETTHHRVILSYLIFHKIAVGFLSCCCGNHEGLCTVNPE